jgi:hypothetical protein
MNVHIHRAGILNSTEHEDILFGLAIVEVASTVLRTGSILAGVDVSAISERISDTLLATEKVSAWGLEFQAKIDLTHRMSLLDGTC